MEFLLGRWSTEDVLEQEAHLMYLPFGGSGYTGLRPHDIEEMPLDKLLWHSRELGRRRAAEAEAMRNASGRGAPTPPEA